MPGGQFTNLREQARSLGIDETRWPEVARAYAQVNEMFGDIVKVTPTSKVVGDMALMMVTSGLTPEQVLDPHTQIAFPGVGRLAVPRRPRPAVRRLPASAAEESAQGRAAVDGAAGRSAAADRSRRRRAPSSTARPGARSTDEEFASYLMYPKVFLDYMQARPDLRAGHGAADADVLLRPGARRRGQRRHRARQDADRALRRRERRARGRHAHGVLRAERPAALGQGAGSQSRRAQAAAPQGRSRQRESRGRADAGHRGDGAGQSGRPRDARRRAA